MLYAPEIGEIVSPMTINDIRIFIEHRLATISTENDALSPTWPGKSIIKRLTKRAGGLFVWADTTHCYGRVNFTAENRGLVDYTVESSISLSATPRMNI